MGTDSPEIAREERINEMQRWAEATGKITEAFAKAHQDGQPYDSKYGVDPDSGLPYDHYAHSPKDGFKDKGIKNTSDGDILQYERAVDGSVWSQGKLRSPANFRKDD
jgi:hypothetical protein